MVLKGRWETKEKDDTISFLLNQAPEEGKIVIKTKGLNVSMGVEGGFLVSFKANGRRINDLWEIKGVLLRLLDNDSAEFVITDEAPQSDGKLKVPFMGLMMEVMALRDRLNEEKESPPKDAILRLKDVPKGGDLEAFFRRLRLRFKNDVRICDIRKAYYLVHPKYLDLLVGELVGRGHATLKLKDNSSALSLRTALLVAIAVAVAAAIGGFFGVLLALGAF
ncbi:MAG: hypothetical protein GXO29_06400 [Thermotogae bacterium]|nr:hypothetical protein [Thermotogota bacterium]